MRTLPKLRAALTRGGTGVLLAVLAVSAGAQPPFQPAPAMQPTAPAPSTNGISPPAPTAAPVTLKPFAARYKVEAYGFTGGTADIVLRNGNAGRYEYSSTLHPHGIFRLIVPAGATLATSAEMDGGSVRPLRYREEDGTSSTDDDVALDFDWHQGVVRGTAHDKPVSLPLEAHTQDPMSIQLAVLLDFANKREPLRYSMVDKTKIKVYEYKSEGRARLDTALGPIDTVIYSSNRPGQPTRLTRFWYAPALDYLTVRSEDINDGKLRVRMTILSLKR